jgi:hypothetical protein
MATIVLIIVAGLAVLWGFFRFLQWRSDKTYRPTAQEVSGILRSLVAGELRWPDLDEFSCVRIAYDPRLDDIRRRFNAVLESPGNIDSTNKESPTARLTQVGQSQVKEIIRELDALAT